LLCNPVDILLSCCTLSNSLTSSCLVLSCARATLLLAFRLASVYLFRSLAVLVFFYLMASFFSSIALATSSFHRHVSLCLGGPFVHPHTCSVAFCHTSYHCIPFAFYIVSFKYLIFSICYQPSKFLVLHWALSASILSALVCAFSFSSLVQN